MNDVEATATEVDVAIVGFGPVGQVLTALLGRAGHTVGCFERHGECYTLRRAIRLDGEAMRLFTRLGIRDEIDAEPFGGVADVADLPELVDELRDRITGRAIQPARL